MQCKELILSGRLYICILTFLSIHIPKQIEKLSCDEWVFTDLFFPRDNFVPATRVLTLSESAPSEWLRMGREIWKNNTWKFSQFFFRLIADAANSSQFSFFCFHLCRDSHLRIVLFRDNFFTVTFSPFLGLSSTLFVFFF